MNFRRFAFALVLALLAIVARPVQADDLADEADLHFKIGTERYAAKDFRGALEHFLASNRLVPNRNVVFNVARTYEQLAEFPNAFRYYTQVIDMSPDDAAKARVEESLARIRPNVGVIVVNTEPAGATVYIDRKDLGSRGNTPRSLGFPAGSYRIIVELPGYEPATLDVDQLKAGEQRSLTLPLKLIVGTLRVDGDPGVSVRVDSAAAPPQGVTPIDLFVPPGRHRVFLSRDGFQSAETEVEVVARQVATATARLAPTTGTLVVNADEPDALVEVDGKPLGFTPAVLTVQSGKRKVRVSQTGFRPTQQEVEVKTNEQTRIDVQLRQLEEVEAASRTAEAVELAPSSVTIIPAQELRAMGYPTVFEAMRGVRGVYVTDDTLYPTAGIRGFSRPGDYGNGVLTLQNGQPTHDNWVGSSFVGYDFRTDLEDVERIEVVRGPGSVLYGTGAFSGVINVVTRRAPKKLGAHAFVSSSEYGVYRGRVAADLPFGRDSGLWVAVAGAHGEGRDYEFREARRPAQITAAGFDPGFDGRTQGTDGFDAGTISGGLYAGAFSTQWLMNFRDKSMPTAPFGTTMDNPDTRFMDARGFVEAKFEPQVNEYLASMTRASLDHYRFNGSFQFVPPPTDESYAREKFRGYWGTLEQRFVVTPIPELRLTAGAEGQLHFQVDQQGLETDCVGSGATKTCDQYAYLPDGPYDTETFDDHPFEIFAGYGLVDLIPSERLRLSAGVRVDYYSTFGSSGPSPRLALIVSPYENGIVKLMAGRAFRAPTIFEQFYQITGASTGNAELKPEKIWSGELEWTHRLSTNVTLLGSGYFNYLSDLIVQTTTADDLAQYQNKGKSVLTLGAEAEIRREWRQGWMASASYSFQRTRYQDDEPKTLREISNSPRHLAAIKGAVPVVPKLATLATRVSFESGRFDRHDEAADPVPQSETDAAVIWDVVLSGDLDRYGVHYNVGVYNVADWRLDVPVSADHAVTLVPQAGRTFLASGSVNF